MLASLGVVAFTALDNEEVAIEVSTVERANVRITLES